MAGAILSTTVTVAVQVPALLAASVTVSTIVLVPRLAQVKLVADKLKPNDPAEVQLSVEPLFTAAAVVLPLPPASRDTVRFWHTAAGAIASPTVMVMVLLLIDIGD